ncbi:hypothetical protein D3C80_1477460 [compost metagenome]
MASSARTKPRPGGQRTRRRPGRIRMASAAHARPLSPSSDPLLNRRPACPPEESSGARSPWSSASSSPASGAQPSGRPGVWPISRRSARRGSRSWAIRSMRLRASSSGGSSMTPMRRASSWRAGRSLQGLRSPRSGSRSPWRSGARGRRRRRRPTGPRDGAMRVTPGRPDCWAKTACFWASWTDSICATTDPSMCCALRRPVPARGSVLWCRLSSPGAAPRSSTTSRARTGP